MSMTLVIPTHRRVNRQITLSKMPAEVRERIILVSSDKEEAQHLRLQHGLSNDQVLVAKGTTSICEKRHWIMRNVPGDMIFMMDDDLTFKTRHTSGIFWDDKQQRWCDEKFGKARIWHLSTHRELTNLFKKFEQLSDKGWASLGISYFSTNRFCPDAWESNSRLMYAFGINKEAYRLHKLNFSEVKSFEDLHVALNLLELGYPNLLCNEVCVADGGFNAEGGVSESERSREMVDTAALHLAELHPNSVSVRQRDYQNMSRLQVTCRWKHTAKLSGCL